MQGKRRAKNTRTKGSGAPPGGPSDSETSAVHKSGAPTAPPAAARATIRDVAREADVSLGTVSRVLNNSANVRAEVRKRVLAATERLQYVPDAIAQSMRKQASQAIGCMVSDVANPLFSRAVAAAESVLHAADYNMILANSGDDPRREDEILLLFKRRRLDGIIMTVTGDNRPGARERLRFLGIPIVLIERQIENAVDTVSSDHLGGTLQALGYLFNLSHRRIGLVTTSTGQLPGRARVEAFEKAFAARGLALEPSMLHTSGLTSDYGFAATQTMLSGPRPPTAIMAGANQMPGVLSAVRSRGLAVGRDLSIISLGDTDLAELYDPPLTALRWRSDIVGRIAAEILIGRLRSVDDASPFRSIVLPTELIVRQSCRPMSEPPA